MIQESSDEEGLKKSLQQKSRPLNINELADTIYSDLFFIIYING